MEDVYVSDSGWLFLIGGSNRVVDVYRGLVDKAWIDRWVGVLSSRVSNFSNYGVDYIHVAAPEKLAVYHRFLSENFLQSIDLEESPASLLEERIDSCEIDCYVNPINYLRTQSESYNVYHKTDSHWNFYGAFSVYQLVMSRLGLEFETSILNNIPPEGMCFMDLGGKINPPIPEQVFFYSPRNVVKRVWSNPIVEYKEINNKDNEPGYHVGSSVEFLNNNAKHDKSVLIFGDSFSEYRPQLLTGLLAETFKRVRFVWSQNIDYSIVDNFMPDICITETAERFMPFMVPDDNFNLDSYVKDKLSGLKS